jgi:hypothetical protein
MTLLSKLFRKTQTQSIKIEEKLPEAFRLGESIEVNDHQKALKIYKQIVTQSPSCSVAWFNMGVIQSRLDKWQDAVESFSKAKNDKELRISAAFARIKLLIEHGQQLSDVDFPEEFCGKNRSSLGVHGPCHNAANELKKRGYKCKVEGEAGSCKIMCHVGAIEYVIQVEDVLGMLLKNVYRREGDRMINLGDIAPLSDLDRQIKMLDVGRLPLIQAPVSAFTDTVYYRAISTKKIGPYGWVREGRSFDEIAKQTEAEVTSKGMQYIHINTLEDIAKYNCGPGTFFACVLKGEPYVIAMLENIEAYDEPDLKKSIEGGKCVFHGKFFNMPEYPLVHIGLGLPVSLLERTKIGLIVVDNTVNFTEANFQDWVAAVEIKKYTIVDVFLPDLTLVASGRTNLDATVISEIVNCINQANSHLNTTPQAYWDFKNAVKGFYQKYPNPFL